MIDINTIKVGDIIITDPLLNKSFLNTSWWNEWKNKVMTVKEILIEECNAIKVHENTLWWNVKWMLKVECDFIKEGEFNI